MVGIGKHFLKRIAKETNEDYLHKEINSINDIIRYFKMTKSHNEVKRLYNMNRIIMYRLLELKGEKIWN